MATWKSSECMVYVSERLRTRIWEWMQHAACSLQFVHLFRFFNNLFFLSLFWVSTAHHAERERGTVFYFLFHSFDISFHLPFIYFVCSSFNLKLYPINESAKCAFTVFTRWKCFQNDKNENGKSLIRIRRLAFEGRITGIKWNWIIADNQRTNALNKNRSEREKKMHGF